MASFSNKTEVELILLDDVNDIPDPLECTDDFIDIPTTKLQLDDNVNNDDGFRINKIDCDRIIGLYEKEVDELQNEKGQEDVSEKDNQLEIENDCCDSINTNRNDSGSYYSGNNEDHSYFRRNDTGNKTDANVITGTENKRSRSKRAARNRSKHKSEETIEVNGEKNSNQFVCRVCNLSFPKSPPFTEHMRTKHSIYKPFECNICLRAFKIQSLLNEHIR